MSLVRVHNFSISLDGFGVGDDQRLDAPFGHAGMRLVQWSFPTRTQQTNLHGAGTAEAAAGSAGVDEVFASRWGAGIGAEIMGRHKFAPKSEPWPNEDWRGWWGEDPPFHTPVIVLTRHPRAPLVMAGGNTFHFVDASPAVALEQARTLAGGLDVRIGGGVQTIREFLQADLIDEMHLAVVPIILGRGERLWDGLEGIEERFNVESVSSPSGVTHLTFWRR